MRYLVHPYNYALRTIKRVWKARKTPFRRDCLKKENYPIAFSSHLSRRRPAAACGGQSTKKESVIPGLQLRQTLNVTGWEFPGPWGVYQRFRLRDSQFVDSWYVDWLRGLSPIHVRKPVLQETLEKQVATNKRGHLSMLTQGPLESRLLDWHWDPAEGKAVKNCAIVRGQIVQFYEDKLCNPRRYRREFEAPPSRNTLRIRPQDPSEAGPCSPG